MMKTPRLIIYAKDIQRITGRSERYAYSVQAAIRKNLQKKKHQLITVQELSKHLGLPEEEVARFIND